MKIHLSIKRNFNLKNIDHFFNSLSDTTNNFEIDSTYLNSTHFFNKSSKETIFYYIKTKSNNTNARDVLIYWCDHFSIQKVENLLQKHNKLKTIYLFSPNNKVTDDQLPKNCKFFFPAIHLKQLHYNKVFFLSDNESLEFNLKNSLINAIYSKGAIPLLQFDQNLKSYKIKKNIPLSLNHSLVLLVKNHDN